MVIPLGDDNTWRRTTPFVVWGLVGANCVVWLLQLALGPSFTNGFSTVPYEIAHGVDLVGPERIAIGGESLSIPEYPGPRPIYLTMVTAMFMHGSWMHILGNMLYLWIFGDQIEDLLGHLGFVAFYLACGLAAGLAQVWSSPDSIVPSLGASGAIAGVLGAYLVKYPTNRVRVFLLRVVTTMPAYLVLGFWFLLQVVGQVGTPEERETGVAYWAHIGGFLAGVVLILIFGRRRTVAPRS
jgi:membrane associated rhomboid family serine protease